jgi:flagella basal body P-ring formation protein FlgA
MISSASLLVGVALLVPGDTAVPPAVAARVAALVAERWEVPAESLVLAWGTHAAWPAAVADLPMRLIGGGGDGWFVLTLDPPEGRPSAVRVRAGVRGPAPVAARDLTPGHALAAEDLRLELRVTWGPPTERPEAAVMAGWEVRRAVAAGTVLSPPLVQPARLVAPGDPVTFVWTRGTVVLERVGIARAGARLGEPVQAVVGEARLHGIVIAPRRARLEEAP